MGSEFEPKIIGFLCNWCTSAAADLAGVMRIQYPPNIINIRVMCSGSVDPIYILEALFEGADGVLIGGCHPGDCHYMSGNYKARRRVAILKTILKTLGLEDNRVKIEWISASEGKKFAEVVTQMTSEIKELGPNPISKKWEV
jgi:F420-non-reducing hydrogenase iron-sulfur subunit